MSQVNFDELISNQPSKSQLSNAIRSLERTLAKNKIKSIDDREYYQYQLQRLKKILSEYK